MPTASLTIDFGILSRVGIMKAKESRDGLALSSGVLALYTKFRGKGNPKWDTGGRYSADIAMVEPTTFTDFAASGGYAQYSATMAEPSRTALYTMADVGATVKISGYEQRIYSSGNALAEKIQRDIDALMGAAQRNWTRQFVSGAVSGWTSWNTINGIDRSTGFLEDDAVASQGNSVGGLSKATFNVRGWTNPVTNFADAYGTNGLSGMFSLLTSVRRYKDGGKKGILASDAGVNNLKRSVLAYERFGPKDDLDAGRIVGLFQGVPVILEPQMPIDTASGGSASNTNPMTYAIIDTDDLFPVWSKGVQSEGMQTPDGYFGVGEFMHVSRQNAWEMPLHVAGQTVALALGGCAVGHSGQTY